MRYNSITKFEVCNGLGVGQSLYTQGCERHCKGCFNEETWDLEGGSEWTPEVEEEFMLLLSRPYIIRLSILGGEPLLDCNIETLKNLIFRIRQTLPHIRIWLYTGYTYEDLITNQNKIELINMLDYIVDGEYIEEQKDLTLKFRGSTNQRIIDIQQTLIKGRVIEWENTSIL